jgi:integrase/recombinase XerC
MMRAPLAVPQFEEYLQFLAVERKLAALTVAAYGRDLRVLESLAASEPHPLELIALEQHHIRRFAAALHGRGLSGRAIARALSAWRTFYTWLALRGVVTANPVNDVRAPKVGKRLPKALAPELVIQLVAAPVEDGHAGTRDHAVFELFYSSGLRLSELVALDASYHQDASYRSAGWLDLNGAEVTVTGKGGKKRTVPVGAPALDALRAWLAVRAGWLGTDPKPLFLSAKGKRLSGRTIQHRLKAHAVRLGIPANVHPHVLRHSFASHLLQSSGDLRAVQELLGHTSIAATQVYTSLDFQRLASVYDAAHPRARKVPTPR